MKQWLSLTLLMFILAQAKFSLAHAVVTSYSLKITPIHAQQADKIELTFNSKIELGLSQIYLVSKGDKHTLLKAENGHKQGLVVVSMPALAPGDYAIRFKVFAADGHLTEDIIHFTVSKRG